jgi:glycogen operon protein
LGPGGYQLGHHPAGFAEWNDRYRDAVRRYWRGDSGMRPEVAGRLAGSADIFGTDRIRQPWASINFVASHDGFTLHDVVSYGQKHNEANGEENRDGANENWSSNWGEEGPTGDARISALRERVKRSMLVTVFASLGTPMLLAGDEAGRTQEGNNNPYCQDNEVSRIDWTRARSPEYEQLIAFVSRLIAIRRAHAVFRPRHFLHGEKRVGPDISDIDWFDERGLRLAPEDWENREGRALVLSLAGNSGGRSERALVLMNASDRALDFQLPAQSEWQLLIDSADPEIKPQRIATKTYRLLDRAAAILITSLQ